MQNLYLINTNEPFKGHVQSSVSLIDGVHYVDYSGGLYNNGQGNLTLEQYKEIVTPDVKLIDGQELDQLLADHYKSLITEPEEITKDRFWDMLEILPPARWHNCGGFEVFHVIERLTGDLVSWFAHSGDRYFEFVDTCKASDEHLREKLSKAFNS